MKDKLENALTEILNKTVDGVESSISFLSDELPELINQILMWYAVESFIWFMLGVCMVAIPTAKRKSIKEWFTGDTDIEIKAFSCIGWFIYCLATILFLSLNHIWLKILIAPKLFLIEYYVRIKNS